MDRSALARKRRQDAPGRLSQMKGSQQGGQLRRPVSGKIKTAKDSNEIIRLPRRLEPLDRPSTDDDASARHFTVANVGAGGLLYLKPSRKPPPSFTQPPATPPDTPHGESGGVRQSNVSGSWTPQLRAARMGAYDHAIPVPPLSLANASQKRRPRSHSFSTVGERVRSPTFDSNDFQLLVNGKDTDGRPKSSVDLSGGFLDLQIPHYRLGTPRFSERGTAYLHSSMYTTTTTDDMRSSVLSRAEYDKLFPAPPGRMHGSLPASRNASSAHLHPSVAYTLTPTRTPPTPPMSCPSPPSGITPAIFDRVEANPNDPAIVRYNPQGRISAATSTRLIAQITSPLFLDYELLSDFFLTYRSFLPCRDLLEYLLARMKWALGTTTDAGRIVRVRTFVALRHWILNYFADDFVLDVNFRQRFCDLVNELTQTLQQRADRGGSDLNIIGELKKCWRRTCAMYWPLDDALDASAEADLVPGGDQRSSTTTESAASTRPPLQRQPSRRDFRRASVPLQILAKEHPDEPQSGGGNALNAFGPATRASMRTASIPTSPMSQQSLQVLSCSVPFLRHARSKADGKSANARPLGPHREPPVSVKNARPHHQHKRSGSFSDALRDKRTPLPSAKVDSVDIRALSAIAFTGGLVRGLLLQPSPAKVELLIPISPGLDLRNVPMNGIDENYFDRSGQSLGVKRLVGDVRRALSSRHRRDGSPPRSHGSHRSTNSSGSRSSATMTQAEKQAQASAWQQLRGPPRVDVLGDQVGRSYDEAFVEANLPNPADEFAQKEMLENYQRESSIASEDIPLSPPRPRFDRLNSGMTTGSRSIVIMDDTGPAKSPLIPGALPSVSSWSSGMAPQPLFRGPKEALLDRSKQEYHAGNTPPRQTSSYHGRPSEDVPLHDLLAMPESWQNEQGLSAPAFVQARKSSGVHSPTMDMPAILHQLRRRPGGDLKAADHVHELQPRPQTPSFSTMSYSAHTSRVLSRELSGTHFSGHKVASWPLPTDAVPEHGKKDSVSLLEMEPNLRPSFEAQVSKLSNLSDRSRDGGIEDTLRRLEGQQQGASSTNSMLTGTNGSAMPALTRQKSPPGPLRVTNASISADDSASSDLQGMTSPRTETQGASIYHPSGSEDFDDYMVQSTGSTDPYGRSEAQDSTASVLPAASRNHEPTQTTAQAQSPPKAVAFAKPDETQRADRTTLSDSAPKSSTPQGSFLLDDNESLSDISTEIADQSDEENFGVRSFFFDDTVDDDNEDALPRTFRAPPTPPSTVGAPPEMSPKSMARIPEPIDAARLLKGAQSAPKLLSPNLDRQCTLQQQLSGPLQPPPSELRRVRTQSSSQAPAHMPFVLAFESEIVAEQLTIIEKDALDEIDWKDLIGLNWHQSPPNVRNWVEYLKQEDSTGIDIVVARFNLVVKWVVSEIVLTAVPSERARCIAKYIHIATHCHRFRNYASMYQITLALLSADLACLHMTWALVAPTEKLKLERLEKLCQPIRNFHNLRAEMETSSTESGCIPFIGLYTHDLMYNAQKPSRIEPTPPSKEALVNFERYQTAAMVVKSLLRLIEASSKYVFHPHPEVLSRCLWLAALEDVDIVRRSKVLEQ